MPAPGLLANDADLDLDPLQAIPLSGPASGSLALAPSGAFVYTPTLNFNGLITFTYRVTDGLAFSNQAAVTVTVSPANDPPLAADDLYTTPEDAVLTVPAPACWPTTPTSTSTPCRPSGSAAPPAAAWPWPPAALSSTPRP